eukprot:6191661-Pleurochrysis_carterae.AAC.5
MARARAAASLRRAQQYTGLRSCVRPRVQRRSTRVVCCAYTTAYTAPRPPLVARRGARGDDSLS